MQYHYEKGGFSMHPDDKSMALNVGKTILVLVGVMCLLIIFANVLT